MNEREINKLIEQKIKESESKSRFSLTPISTHNHDGINSPRVSSVNLIHNNKVLVGVVGDNENSYFTINTAVANPTTVYADGIIRNPVTGTATTKVSFSGMAHLGNCFYQTSADVGGLQSSFLQTCWGTQFTDTGNRQSLTLTDVVASGATTATLNANWTARTAYETVIFSNGETRNVLLTNGSAAISWVIALTSAATASITYGGGIFIPTVYVDNRYICTAADPNNARIELLRYNNTSLTFNFVAASDWQITCHFYFT